jgi:hypothetical protein
MKKIGIITYQDIADGKGRFLQAYALYSAIKQLNYIPEIIDYYPRVKSETTNQITMEKIFRVLNNFRGYFSAIVDLLKNKLIAEQLKGKRNKYNSFILEKIKITDEKYFGYSEIQSADLGYHAYVCGSDQIWNPKFSGKDPAYYLQFAPQNKRIAYAPSMGTTSVSSEELKTVSEMIAEIPYVSMREASGAALISDTIGKQVFNAIDPTFLMPRQWWNEFANKPAEKEPYVLTFFFDNSTYQRQMAKKIAKELGCKIISIPDTIRDVLTLQDKKIDICPEEFVSLFKNASFICTQSFHGTVLALLYNRPFYVFDRQTKAYVSGVFSRIQDLLEKVDLTDRILAPGRILPKTFNTLNFDSANSAIERERATSLEFLKNALEKTTGVE